MFESIINFFKRKEKKEGKKESSNSRETAKERLHLVLMQDRANVSADFLELMKQEIIEVIKKYIEIDEGAIDVRLTNKENEDGTNGAPALYANIPILNIKHDVEKLDKNAKEKVEIANNKANEKAVEKEIPNKDKQVKDKIQTEKKNTKINSDIDSDVEMEISIEKKQMDKKENIDKKSEFIEEKKEVKSEKVKEKE